MYKIKKQQQQQQIKKNEMMTKNDWCDDESAFDALVFAVVVDHFVDWNFNGNGFGDVDGDVLLNGHGHRFLDGIGHVLFDRVGHRFLNGDGDGFDDRNGHGLRHVDVDGIGLRHWHSNGFWYWHGHRMRNWNTNVLVNGNWDGFLDFNGLRDDVSAVTVLLAAAVASLVSAAVTAGEARIYCCERDYQ